MNRRLILTSIASFAAAPVILRSVLAQNTPAPAAASAPAGQKPQLSAARQIHIKDTMTVGSLSLMLSRIAEPKVNTAMLKQFAGFEIAEQETIANILNAIQHGEAPNGAIPKPSDAEAMQNLDDAGKSQVEKLRQMKAGWAFDQEYLRAEIDGHNKLLQIQETYLRSPDDLDETNVAKLARGMIKEHLTLLGDMQGMGQHAERMRGHMRMR
jgi:putative membrane protein